MDDMKRLYDKDSGKIEILVDVSHAGMKENAWHTVNQFGYMAGKDKIENVVVRETGCLGDASNEPIVQINMPGKEPVLYGKITGDKVYDILDKHIKQGKVISEWVIQ